MKSEDLVLVGPCFGEMFWEFFRFAPYFFWIKKTKNYNKNVKFVVLTRSDRFDIYGSYVDAFVPLEIEGDDFKYKQDCFRLNGVENCILESIIKKFHDRFGLDNNIVDFIHPSIQSTDWYNKDQFSIENRIFEYKPRTSNKYAVDCYLNNLPKKQLVVIAPRFRIGMKRNWPYWPELYRLIQSDRYLMNQYNFILCGSRNSYIKDPNRIFLDIEDIDRNINTSTIGLLLELIKKSVITIGSQSAIPNISLLFGVETIEWGNQRELHTETYNIKKSPVTYIDDPIFNINPEEIFTVIQEKLKGVPYHVRNNR